MTASPTPLRVAFVGGFAACFVEPVRARVVTPCELLTGDERELLARLGDVEVVVTLAFTPAMGAAASRVRLVQVPGAGVDRIDRGALPPGAMVANAVTPGTAHVTYQPVWDEAAPTVARIARPGDLVITVGCGDVTKVAPQIVDEIQRLTEAVR